MDLDKRIEIDSITPMPNLSDFTNDHVTIGNKESL